MNKRNLIILSVLCALAFPQVNAAQNSPAQKEQTPEYETITDENASNQEDFDIKKYSKVYKGVTKDGVVMQALEMMKGTIADYSYNAIMGNNLTHSKINIKFRNLAEIKPEYESFDALGWKSKGKLYIYLNSKHMEAPPEAIAAVLAHEAIHQDEFPSLNEETYAWTMEAATWMQLTENNDFAVSSGSSLVEREEMLKKLFIKGNYTDKYIKKAVWTNPGYKDMPSRSPGFEDEHL